MKIGLTYDLREEYMALGFDREAVAEFDCIETIDAIDAVLHDMGFQTCRIGHVLNLIRRIADGERWDLVFNIAEGLDGFGREAQVPAILEACGIPYTFSDPMVMSLTLHKGMTKHIIKSLGFPTPDFAVVRKPEDITAIRIPFPLFVKPIAEGTSRGISDDSLVTDAAALRDVCLRLLETYRQPVLVETYLPGREFTVGIIGTDDEAKAIGVMEVRLTGEAESGGYSYLNKAEWETRVKYSVISGGLAQEMERLALGIWRALHCRDGGRVDFRLDADGGKPSFLEINPLAGLNPSYSDLCILARLKGISYAELIGAIVTSALKRSAQAGVSAAARLADQILPLKNVPPADLDFTSSISMP
ncbi:MAG: D-alanine--D-alanine ligase [bacterium]